MQFTVATLAAMLMSNTSTYAAACSNAMTVRPMADLRIWQTVKDVSEPLKWPWELESDKAVLFLSNRLTRAKSTIAIEKSVSELYGSCTVPAPKNGREAFYLVELVLYSGSSEVARYSADLAYVNGTPGRPLTVRSAGTKEWKRFSAPSLTTYDSAWSNATGSAKLTTTIGGNVAATELSGTSGYAIISSGTYGPCRFDLGFGNIIPVWSADLYYIGGGLSLVFQ